MRELGISVFSERSDKDWEKLEKLVRVGNFF